MLRLRFCVQVTSASAVQLFHSWRLDLLFDACSSFLSLSPIILRPYVWGRLIKQISAENSRGCHGMFVPRVNPGNILRRLARAMSHDYIQCSMQACVLPLTRFPIFQIVGLKLSLVARCPGGKCYRNKHVDALPMPRFLANILRKSLSILVTRIMTIRSYIDCKLTSQFPIHMLEACSGSTPSATCWILMIRPKLSDESLWR